MAKHVVGVVVGSAHRGSINQKVATALEKLADGQVRFKQIQIDDLPMFSQDLEGAVPESVERLRREVKGVDGLLFVTPEYNRSLPPLLTNAIAWASRPYGHNVWAGKPAAIMGASIGPIRTANAQAHLKTILGYLDVRLIGQPEVYIHFQPELVADDGTIADAGLRGVLEAKIAALAGWVAKLA
ncbi:NADPH-dependent FMN reductase [Flaviflagellibacter deserti]|uniref:NADPH-dependent FMN reductase n=1 Tax=Flaviflagellibacter deserti TaxID=2267266 RepID=A0ABV9Z4F9_9HYPH